MELDFLQYLAKHKREMSTAQREGLGKFLRNLDCALGLYLEKPDEESIKTVLAALAGPRKTFQEMKYPNCNLTMFFRFCDGCPCAEDARRSCSAIRAWSQLLRGGECLPEVFLHFMQLKAQLEVIK